MTKTDLYQWIDDAKSRPPGEDSPGLNSADTWISPRHRYFCMAIPKNACTKTKLVLQQLDGLPLPLEPDRIHYRDEAGLAFLPSIADFSSAEGVEILTSPDWFRFAFARNPYARLFSAYKSQVMDLNSPYVGFRESIRQAAGYPTASGATPGRVGFADFVAYIGGQTDGQRDGHWKSQTGSLHLERIRYDFIGRVESFAVDFAGVLRRFGASPELLSSLAERVNTTPALPLAAAYGKRLADTVYAIYEEDFERFGYARDSWMFLD
jgi:hypothetical protein